MPGCGGIPEFQAWEYAILNSPDPQNPSEIAMAVKELLENEALSATGDSKSLILEFAASYIKWMFRVLQDKIQPTKYPKLDMDGDEEITVILGSFNEKFDKKNTLIRLRLPKWNKVLFDWVMEYQISPFFHMIPKVLEE